MNRAVLVDVVVSAVLATLVGALLLALDGFVGALLALGSVCENDPCPTTPSTTGPLITLAVVLVGQTSCLTWGVLWGAARSARGLLAWPRTLVGVAVAVGLTGVGGLVGFILG